MLSVDVRTTTMTTILRLWIVVATTLLPNTDGAAWNSWFGNSNSNVYTASEEAVSLQKLENYWLDAMDVVTELGSYETLWIKPHSCVWSECAVDDTDDGYMGDNRDGDEQWYQYRTQGFCANAGYSLYGRKHHDVTWMPTLLQGRCTRQHYINSFFTYGGADNLLSALGITPVVYYDNDNDNNNNNNNNDDDGNGIQISANAMCYEVDQYNVVDDYFMTQYQNQNNENGDNADDDQSNSGSQEDYEGYTETLGCGPSGEYIVGAFQSGSCDGNYFAGVVDPFDDYNAQHNALGCHPLYAKDDTVLSVENVYMLLNNSWSCDLRLYPDGCPDPYQLKEQYDFAMRTVIHGGNAQRAYRTMTIQKPLHIATYLLLGVTGALFILAYLIKNEQRVLAQHQGGGKKSIGGYAQCVGEDLVYQGRRGAVALAVVWRAFVGWFRVTVLQKERYTTDDEGTTTIAATTAPTPTLAAAETKKSKKDKKKDKKKRKSKSGKTTKTSEETTTTSDDSYGQPNMYVTDITDTKNNPTTTGSDYVRQEDDDIEAVADIDRNGMVSLTRSKSGFKVSNGMATTTKKS